ncbi:hypothetical protein GWK47_017386 [Chionoecetes opilio]|uniref:Uncharacterized protein n=1 Tax=Chionoecetes opilio TaxID=41210 RepID=A0A8J5CJ45_CHIOP|nr:hypothetical protein GWK47_017386 [Chionoecetes opilio]
MAIRSTWSLHDRSSTSRPIVQGHDVPPDVLSFPNWRCLLPILILWLGWCCEQGETPVLSGGRFKAPIVPSAIRIAPNLEPSRLIDVRREHAVVLLSSASFRFQGGVTGTGESIRCRLCSPAAEAKTSSADQTVRRRSGFSPPSSAPSSSLLPAPSPSCPLLGLNCA